MLSAQDNELLCRVGPGTPMGNLMRQYWIPAIRVDELPSPDCPPLRVRLLGENLIGFRATSGEVGLIQNTCPHRGASLFFGRNEENGLRCIYHGWKFDARGACVDMPSEPPESNFKDKVKVQAYPCVERNGVIWTYMGPRATPPPLPDLEHNLLNTEIERISILHRQCNWMQGWEGEMDTVHAAFLHFGATRYEEQEPGSFDYYQYRERAPRFQVLDTDVGVSYGAYRPAEEDTHYWRIAHMMFPFYAIIPAGSLGMYVPMDDEHTLHWEIRIRPEAFVAGAPAGIGSRRDGYLPNTTDWYGRFNLVQNMTNDYLIDREAQRSWQSYSGIPGVRQQDMAVTDSMGPVMDRTSEHLGTTDVLIIRVRRRLLAAAEALRDHGITPIGVDRPELYHMRTKEFILPRDADWWEATREARERFDAPVERSSTEAVRSAD